MSLRARKITDHEDLGAIHRVGEGFVVHPFARKLHSARCPTVPGMALNPEEPRWFAPDVATALALQSERLARYPTAQPFDRVRCCAALVPAGAVAGEGGDSVPQPNRPPAKADDWTITSSAASVELWTTTRTRFGADQSPTQKTMVREITPAVSRLKCVRGERLHGVFVSDESVSRQPDAENIAFYNFGSAPFVGARSALGFERSYSSAPPAPRSLAAPARFFHRWSVRPADAPLEYWYETENVASWNVPIDLGGELGLAAWRALREHPEGVTVAGTLTAAEPFGIDCTLATPDASGPAVVKAIKGLVDGPLAGLQRAEELSAPIISRLLERRWGRPIDEPTLRRLVGANAPPSVLPRAPFNRNGLDPCDELCVAGLVHVVPSDGEARLQGRVFRVDARPDTANRRQRRICDMTAT